MVKKSGDDLLMEFKCAGASDEQIQTAFVQGPRAVCKLMETYRIQPPNYKTIPKNHSGRYDTLIQKLRTVFLPNANNLLVEHI